MSTAERSPDQISEYEWIYLRRGRRVSRPIYLKNDDKVKIELMSLLPTSEEVKFSRGQVIGLSPGAQVDLTDWRNRSLRRRYTVNRVSIGARLGIMGIAGVHFVWGVVLGLPVIGLVLLLGGWLLSGIFGFGAEVWGSVSSVVAQSRLASFSLILLGLAIAVVVLGFLLGIGIRAAQQIGKRGRDGASEQTGQG